MCRIRHHHHFYYLPVLILLIGSCSLHTRTELSDDTAPLNYAYGHKLMKVQTAAEKELRDEPGKTER